MLKNVYETVIIMTPVLSDNQTRDITKEYENHLKRNDAQVRYQEHWGLKRLVYPIQKKQSGWYCLLEYDAAPDLIFELDLKLRRDERVMRFLTVKLDKNALEYAERRKKKIKSKEEKGTKEQDVA
ncbi:MAG: 30S ribosomal protein S6 [Flavobacteriales bacterium Tduv]